MTSPGDTLLVINSPSITINLQFGDVAVADGSRVFIRNNEPSNDPTYAQGKIYEYALPQGELLTTYVMPGKVHVGQYGSTAIGTVMDYSSGKILSCFKNEDGRRRARLYDVGTSVPTLALNHPDALTGYEQYEGGVIMADVGLTALAAKNRIYFFSNSSGEPIATAAHTGTHLGHYMVYEDNTLLVADDKKFYKLNTSGTLLSEVQLDRNYSNLSAYKNIAYSKGKLALGSSIYTPGLAPEFTVRIYDVGTSIPAVILPAPPDLRGPNSQGSCWGYASLAIAGDVLAVGAYDAHIESDIMAGVIYLYNIHTGQLLDIVPNPEVDDPRSSRWQFGENIHPAGRNFLVGEQSVVSSNPPKNGRCYLIQGSGPSAIKEWTEHQ